MPAEISGLYNDVRAALLREKGAQPFWTGALSQSALSTATAVSALSVADCARHAARIAKGLAWLARTQNADGGWGDTACSQSNISTTWLVRAAFALNPDDDPRQAAVMERCRGWLERAGGVAAVLKRYGDDKTFSAPILANLALAGLVPWDECPQLPYWLAACPRQLLKFLGLRVVSYALPALIAVGVAVQAKRSRVPAAARLAGFLSRERVLRVLADVTPESGGYLEAAPLTSFVAMSLAAAGRRGHPALAQNLEFLCAGQDQDGAWKIDRDLAVWVTTSSIAALGGGDAETRDWLLRQQTRSVHLYTGAAPGAWGWTHHSGSVPDADDTAGALLALKVLPATDTSGAAARGIAWLLNLQNRDGGWPAFCRGWRQLPFDRSCPDITAHVLRAFAAWKDQLSPALARKMDAARARALEYLLREQRPDGSWIPLWFGNERAPQDENPVFGTARALLAARAAGFSKESTNRALAFLKQAQNPDGSWGGAPGVAGSIEETAAACEALLEAGPAQTGPCAEKGVCWLRDKIRAGGLDAPAPIGLYFAKLWYSERLYPLIFATSALRRYLSGVGSNPHYSQCGLLPATCGRDARGTNNAG